MSAAVSVRVGALSRRRMLSVVGASLSGGLIPAPSSSRGVRADDPAPRANSHDPTFGRAKRCLLLFLTGGPPQHDTWDPKPDAPASVRGEFGTIATSTPGLFVTEMFPRLARAAGRFRIVRSLTHADTVHTTAGYAMLTGGMHPQAGRVASATMTAPHPSDRPHLASIAHRFSDERGQRLPPFALPEVIKDAAVNEFPGLSAGFLGKRHDPVLVEADAMKTAFQPPLVARPPEVSPERLASRRELLSRLDFAGGGGPTRRYELLFQNAVGLSTSPLLQRALRLDDESPAAREAYGSHLFGQGALLARRLLKADARFVSVYWHYEGPDDSPVWDTHWNNFDHLRKRLAPPTDQALAALLDDLADRGLLDETLVLCLGEFGRTPKINGKAGRDHWPQVANALVAGAGVPGGTVVGASDASGAYPTQTPITPEDWGATVLHWLGVDPHWEIHDQLNRPHKAGLGTVRPELFG